MLGWQVTCECWWDRLSPPTAPVSRIDYPAVYVCVHVCNLSLTLDSKAEGRGSSGPAETGGRCCGYLAEERHEPGDGGAGERAVGQPKCPWSFTLRESQNTHYVFKYETKFHTHKHISICHFVPFIPAYWNLPVSGKSHKGAEVRL